MEVPLTQPCPDCGADMEPTGRARHGRTVYTCPECGHEMETPEREEDGEDEEVENDSD